MDRIAESPPGAEIRKDPANGTVIFLSGNDLSSVLEQDPHFRQLQSSNLMEQVALEFLSAYSALFKIDEPKRELTVKSAVRDDLGAGHVRFQQVFEGLPVWACEIMVHLDKADHVTLIQARYIPTPVHVSVRPGLSETDARRVVAKVLKAKGLGEECSECGMELVIFVNSEKMPVLAYRVRTRVSLVQGWIFTIDARTGKVLEELSANQDGGAPR
jgi:Zn-dependent metalloprotease